MDHVIHCTPMALNSKLFFATLSLLSLIHGLPLVLLRDSLASEKVVPGMKRIWSDCSSPGDPMKIVNISFSPNSPRKGQELHITTSLRFNETVTGGTVHLTLACQHIGVFYNQTSNLCHDLQHYLKCPISPGIHNTTALAKIPESVPPCEYTANAVARDQKGKQLACVHVVLRIH